MSVPTVTNGAIAVHHTATVDTAWDGPAAVAAMPNDAGVLKYCHAYVDSTKKSEAKGSYSFPHHKTDGGPANMAACRNGMSRLAGSNVPIADKPGVERHLKAHLSDGGSDEPDADDHQDHKVMGGRRVSNERRDWFTIRNADSGEDGPAQVYIYDEIGGGGWFSDGITASNFVTELNDIKNKAIDLHINSPGGDVFDGIAIYNAIRRHSAYVRSYIDGLAASAASFIAQAGDDIVIERNAQMMVHDASGICFGNASDMAKMTDLLNKASNNIADIYAQRTGVSQSTWRDVMKQEAWYSSSEAVLAGLADSVAPEPVTTDNRLTNRTRFDLKALGARYGSRQEAPEPPPLTPLMRHVRVDGALVGAQGRPGAPEDVAVAAAGVERPRAHTDVDVTIEPVPVRALTVFEQAILDVVARGMAGQQAESPAAPGSTTVTWTDPVSTTTTSAAVPAVVVVPEVKVVSEPADSEPGLPVFDSEAFRAAIRAAVASS